MIYTTSETGTWPGVKLGVPQRIKEKKTSFRWGKYLDVPSGNLT
jgi:hypothetical protein